MSEIKAYLRYLRMAPRKVRVMANIMKGKSVKSAETQLQFAQKNASLPLRKLLRSAIANAKHNFNIDSEQLIVKTVRVDQGPTLKRSMPRARGMASRINKRTSHITLILSESNNVNTKIKKSI